MKNDWLKRKNMEHEKEIAQWPTHEVYSKFTDLYLQPTKREDCESNMSEDCKAFLQTNPQLVGPGWDLETIEKFVAWRKQQGTEPAFRPIVVESGPGWERYEYERYNKEIISQPYKEAE